MTEEIFSHYAVPAALVTAVVAAAGEWLHARRVARTGRLTFGPAGAPRVWTKAVPFLRVTALAGLPAYLAAGGRSIRGWLAGLNVVTVDFDDTAFANANDAAALAQLEIAMSRAG